MILVLEMLGVWLVVSLVFAFGYVAGGLRRQVPEETPEERRARIRFLAAVQGPVRPVPLEDEGDVREGWLQ